MTTKRQASQAARAKTVGYKQSNRLQYLLQYIGASGPDAESAEADEIASWKPGRVFCDGWVVSRCDVSNWPVINVTVERTGASASARALGKRAAGKSKVYTADELTKRTERLRDARAKRWANRQPDRTK